VHECKCEEMGSESNANESMTGKIKGIKEGTEEGKVDVGGRGSLAQRERKNPHDWTFVAQG
jgi:hypothetical protein